MWRSFDFGLYLLASMTFFIDLLDILLRLYLRREQAILGQSVAPAATSVPLDVGQFTPYERSLHVRPYAVVASVHNLAPEALEQFLDAMAPHRSRLWIVDDASTDDTWDRLVASGVRCVRCERNRQKPGAIKFLLTQLPPDIATVFVVDPDAYILTNEQDLAQVIFEFQRSQMAAVCPRICIRRDGWLTRFQQLEYSLSFSIGRKALADFTLTSGIALYRRDALERALERHSLSVYAEDLENGLLLLEDGERVYYDGRLIVETEGMRSMRRLFSQRVGWSFGLIRVYATHWRRVLLQSGRGAAFTYQYGIYMGVFLLLLHPFKLAALGILMASAIKSLDVALGLQQLPDSGITNAFYFIAVYLKYTALAAILIPLSVRRSERRAVIPVVPLYTFYAVAQVLPTTIGFLNWLTLRTWGRRVYRDHYQPVSP